MVTTRQKVRVVVVLVAALAAVGLAIATAQLTMPAADEAVPGDRAAATDDRRTEAAPALEDDEATVQPESGAGAGRTRAGAGRRGVDGPPTVDGGVADGGAAGAGGAPEPPPGSDAVEPDAPAGADQPDQLAPPSRGRGVRGPEPPDLAIDPGALRPVQPRLYDDHGPDFGGTWSRCLPGGGYEIGVHVSDPAGVAWVSWRWEPDDRSQPALSGQMRHTDGDTWVAEVRSTTHEGWMHFEAQDTLGNGWLMGFGRGAESPRCV